ncbi:MAG: hypothetical protein C4523_11615 [Myxococcales bacterium]|nr:MAG: hypothetical protein C4523_11615 [Myxococcales bacterium]
MKKRTRKSFDCIAFKRRAQERIYEEIKNMTHEEEIAYFKRLAKSSPFAKPKKSAPEKNPIASNA